MANGFKLGESLSPPSLSPNKVLITNNAGKAETSAITTSELNALSGIQGNIQQQINNIGGVAIDDTAASTSTVYSSSKTESLINTSLAQLLDRLYPVGCVVMSFNDMTNEQVVARYGGTTWQRIQDRYLVAAGSNHTVGSTGGSSTVTLSVDNLPEHTHGYKNTIVGSTKLTVNQIASHSHTGTTGTAFTSSLRLLHAAGGDVHANNHGINGTGINGWTDVTNTDQFLFSNHQHEFTTNSTGGGGSHTHGDISQSKTTDPTGSGTAVNIEPPYIAIYMWRRTA